MTVSINTNLGAMIIQKTLNSATNGLNLAAQRLSTGLKINKAADGAAIMSIAKGLEAEIRSSETIQSSIQTGMNILQTAEGDLGLIQGHVSRIRELAVEASSDFYTADERNAMAAEAQACYDEIQRLSAGSNFNGMNLLDGSNQSMQIQVDASSNPAVNSVGVGSSLDDASASALGLTTSISSAFASASAAASYISECDNALNTITGRMSSIGATQNRLESAYNTLSVRTQNNYAAYSTLMDADIAAQSSLYTRQSILQQSAAALLIQANQSPGIALNLM